MFGRGPREKLGGFRKKSLNSLTHFPDNLGTITLVELKEVMKSLGQNPTEEELVQMISSVDDNGDNEIDFEEFLILMSSKKTNKNDPDKELRDAFAVFDADGNGTISKSELKQLMKNLGQTLSDPELDAMMEEVDKDGNGEIDFAEFKTMMVSFILQLLFSNWCLMILRPPISAIVMVGRVAWAYNPRHNFAAERLGSGCMAISRDILPRVISAYILLSVRFGCR